MGIDEMIHQRFFVIENHFMMRYLSIKCIFFAPNDIIIARIYNQFLYLRLS